MAAWKSIEKFNFEERKSDLILRLFVDTADQDYLTARWCYCVGNFHTFAWLAEQAIEKYCKAFLLYQDISVQKFKNHNIVVLFAEVRARDKNCVLPDKITLGGSEALGTDEWQGKSVEEHIKYFNKYGSAHNRYGLVGLNVTQPHLHGMDAICYSLRAAMQSQSFVPEGVFEQQLRLTRPEDKFEGLVKLPWMLAPTAQLERLYLKKLSIGDDEVQQRVFKNLNHAFFDEHEEDESAFSGWSFRGSPLGNHLVRLAVIEPTDHSKEMVNQMREWVRDNVFLPKDIKRQLDVPGLIPLC
jgi:hypothetical protein